MKVLVLGGTTEGRLLSSAVDALPGFSVLSSLAGRVRAPLALPGAVRVGGFGGVAGLRDFLTSSGIETVVDATHPFASSISAHAVSACALAGVPLLVLRRPAWTPVAGDRWIVVPSLASAASAVESFERVFLTTGRQGLGLFASCRSWFLVRTVDAPAGAAPARMELVLDRGPFTLEGELSLLRHHAVEVVVTKNSGGFAPKLEAARTLGVPVIMVDRPVVPDAAPVVSTVDDALSWLIATTSGK
jgi:precorrin-6A/cobalt-precorrin-6A reductase